ncbi:unnamed protein product [Protopolystoma xenopodis]|uniref:Uncharacterized protein n=1 Tax=Protopolystoma xenopodis TaxID=117903 RepID=A0A448WSP5_9PLAT|nr:unnamed protein product [Protopolystoma xenopodis]
MFWHWQLNPANLHHQKSDSFMGRNYGQFVQEDSNIGTGTELSLGAKTGHSSVDSEIETNYTKPGLVMSSRPGTGPGSSAGPSSAGQPYYLNPGRGLAGQLATVVAETGSLDQSMHLELQEDISARHYRTRALANELVNRLDIGRITRRYHASRLVCKTGHPVGNAQVASINIYVKFLKA